MELTSKESALNRLKAANIWSKKQLGQHFLIDEKALETIITTADIQPTDTVVEIGPGMGVLTRELLKKTDNVIAFEFDPDMVRLLAEDLPDLKVVAGDVLRTAADEIAKLESYKVVANIPYQITTPLMKLFLEGGVSTLPQSLTLLVQKEVGQRLAAKPATSERGYLSLLAQYYADVRYVATVPATSFWPAPQVDSAIIHLQVREQTAFDGQASEAFLKYVKRFFTQPRKQLKNVVAGVRGVSNHEVEETFSRLDFASTVRAQELSEEQWKQLYLSEQH